MTRPCLLAWLVLALALPGSGVATAQVGLFERLVMPGEVIDGHAKLEKECKNCHETFSKQAQSKLCLDCHKDIRADIEGNKGFHGKKTDIKQLECKVCHTDHKGRKTDIVRLDADTFDHRQTDYPLREAHLKLACSACHLVGKKHREAPSLCIDCHRKNDRHRGALGEKCADCHGEQSWRGAKFDHNKTDFRLTGAHEKVACAACHASERYKGVPKICADCHRLQDVHGGRYGAKCQTCHAPSEWKKISFDHNKETKFSLEGRHAKAKCDTCHTKRLYEDKMSKECVSCHERDDVHKNRNGKKCESCHAASGWREVRFDHNRDTKYPLLGKHEKVKCELCHRGDLARDKTPKTCIGCHKADDVHKGELGTKCETCHNVSGWRTKVFFNHDLTRMPLIGQHAAVPCEACHVATTYKGTETRCVACHKSDDVHKARLGPNCAFCHNPNGWTLWRFDHDTQTKYPLTGRHAKVDCVGCHTKPVTDTIKLSTGCIDCHSKDDKHSGRFGSRCEQCHVTESWKKLKQIR